MKITLLKNITMDLIDSYQEDTRTWNTLLDIIPTTNKKNTTLTILDLVKYSGIEEGYYFDPLSELESDGLLKLDYPIKNEEEN